jgi:hypothetical protein
MVRANVPGRQIELEQGFDPAVFAYSTFYFLLFFRDPSAPFLDSNPAAS